MLVPWAVCDGAMARSLDFSSVLESVADMAPLGIVVALTYECLHLYGSMWA